MGERFLLSEISHLSVPSFGSHQPLPLVGCLAVLPSGPQKFPSAFPEEGGASDQGCNWLGS